MSASWWRRRDREADLKAEIEAHFNLAVEERMARGETRAQALAAVHREFGSEAHVREVTRAQWSGAGAAQALRELALAFRTLGRTPRFTLAAVLCIGLGIGATMTVFSALHAILLRPLPYPHAEQLVTLRAQHLTHGMTGATVSFEVLDAWRAAPALAAVGAWSSGNSELTGSEDLPERVRSAEVTANLFPLLGVQPLHGRGFDESETAAGVSDVVLLGYDVWRTRFGGDAGVVGSRIELGSRQYHVAGVMPAGFSFPDGTLLWTPLVAPPLPPNVLFYDGAIARLADGATVVDARAQVDAAMRGLQEASGYDGWSFTVATMRDDLVAPLRRPILIFQGAALLVLLLACGNVATLMLARAAARRHELVLRAALGADAARLRGHVLIESGAVALLGGVLGVGLAYAGVRLLQLAFPDGVPSYLDLSVHGPAFLAAAAATLGAALLFGLGPALRAGRLGGSGVLPGVDRVHGAAAAGTRVHGGLVVVQIASAVVLLAAAVLLVRTHAALEQSLGFQHDGVLAVNISLPAQRYADADRRQQFHALLRERLAALPGVHAVRGSATALPLSEGVTGGMARFRIAGAPASPGEREQVAAMHHITPGYLDVFRIPLVKGRDISEDDARAAAATAVVNETFANRYFPGGDVLGRTIDFDMGGSTWSARIVGVVQDFRHAAPPAELPPAVYIDGGSRTRIVVLATDLRDPTVLAPTVRRLIHELDPALTVAIQPHSGVVQRAFWRQRLQRNVITIFAGLTLALALFGVYGVLSYAVSQRTTELGVRLALGASAGGLLLHVLGSAARLAALGVALGLGAAVMLTRLLRGLLYGVDPGDPLILGGVALAVSCTAFCAAALPAWRASRLDPQLVMRGGE